jgi:hypothetical protein
MAGELVTENHLQHLRCDITAFRSLAAACRQDLGSFFLLRPPHYALLVATAPSFSTPPANLPSQGEIVARCCQAGYDKDGIPYTDASGVDQVQSQR